MRIGKDYNVSAAEVALAWVRQQKGVTSTIIGAKTPEQLHSNIHSSTLEIASGDMQELNTVSQH